MSNHRVSLHSVSLQHCPFVFKPAALTHVVGSDEDTRVCPLGWVYQATWVVTEDGTIYTACYPAVVGATPVLRRVASPAHPPVTSPAQNSHWFNFPTFVASFEWGDFVYFVFREKSEFGDLKTISSLARVCKNDVGTGDESARIFSTFAKTRLSCSIPAAGDQDFHFHHLQAVHFSQADQTLYAVFNAPPLQGTVVCLYNMDSVMAAFDGMYRPVYTTNKKVSCPHNLKTCDAPVTPHTGYLDETVNCVRTQNDLLPVNKQPLFFCDKERWTHIAVDRYKTSLGDLSIVYVATETGKIKKLFANITAPNFFLTCQIDSVQVTMGTTPILNMKFSKSEAAVYIAMEHKIVKVPFKDCGRYGNLG
ncbi:hypothetical protein Btru_008059 [Bulinus truncatus]|nr:hypothetical protein Btru_008059 [Bulinus truncatus]